MPTEAKVTMRQLLDLMAYLPRILHIVGISKHTSVSSERGAVLRAESPPFDKYYGTGMCLSTNFQRRLSLYIINRAFNHLNGYRRHIAVPLMEENMK